jgi:hypothetical protein
VTSRTRVECGPFPAEPMRMWPTSPRVNKPENDDPSILEPIELAWLVLKSPELRLLIALHSALTDRTTNSTTSSSQSNSTPVDNSPFSVGVDFRSTASLGHGFGPCPSGAPHRARPRLRRANSIPSCRRRSTLFPAPGMEPALRVAIYARVSTRR